MWLVLGELCMNCATAGGGQGWWVVGVNRRLEWGMLVRVCLLGLGMGMLAGGWMDRWMDGGGLRQGRQRCESELWE